MLCGSPPVSRRVPFHEQIGPLPWAEPSLKSFDLYLIHIVLCGWTVELTVSGSREWTGPLLKVMSFVLNSCDAL